MRALPDGIRVQRAGPADVGRVRKIVEEGIGAYREWAPDWTPPQATAEQRERLRQNFESDHAWILMALTDDDEVVGVISMAASTAAHGEPPPPGTIYLWQMFVQPGWQGSGLAQALMDLAFDEAHSRGFTRMTLWAAAGAARARRFYEREGWTLSGETNEQADFGLPLVQYEHDL